MRPGRRARGPLLLDRPRSVNAKFTRRSISWLDGVDARAIGAGSPRIRGFTIRGPGRVRSLRASGIGFLHHDAPRIIKLTQRVIMSSRTTPKASSRRRKATMAAQAGARLSLQDIRASVKRMQSEGEKLVTRLRKDARALATRSRR